MSSYYEKAIQKQIRIYADHESKKLIETFTSDEIKEKCHVRNINREMLQVVIANEIFIQEYTNMALWPLKDVEDLAKQLHIKWSGSHCDSVHLSWLVCMTIVRENVPYKIKINGSERRIVLC